MVISLSGPMDGMEGMGWERGVVKKKAVRACDVFVVADCDCDCAMRRCLPLSPSLTPTHSDSAGSE